MQENYQHDQPVVISLAAYRAKKRRVAATTAANARRGALITVLLFGAGALCGYTLHREQQLHQLERNVYHVR